MPLRPRIGRFLRGHWASGLLAGPVRLPARRLALWYVRRWLKRKLKATLATVAIQLCLLAAAHAAVSLTGEALPARLAASGLVWALLLYNTTHLVFCTIPSAVRDSRWLRGWRAFFLRDVLAVSIARVLVELDVAMVGVCLLLGLAGRWLLLRSFDLFEPWTELCRHVWG